MDGNVTQFNRRINYLIEETDAVYHEIAVRLGLSDSVMLILYALEDAGGQIPLTTIYRQTGASKQTINSAIRGLEKEGLLYLAQYHGRAKKVVLTDKGNRFAQQTAARIRQAEQDAFSSWTEEEVRTLEKYTECFRREIEKL